MQIRGNRIAQSGAVLVLASVGLLLIGNRWANYVISPIPGLYLVDALFAVGSLLGLARFSVLRSAPRWLWWLFGVLWAYVLVVLVPEYFQVPASDRYDAIRDAAPFLYLSLAPFAALALMAVTGRGLVSLVRWSSLVANSIALLTSIGLLRSFTSPLLGSEFAEIFGSRPDMLGAAIGIGILAWGSWPAGQLQRSFVAQGGLLLSGVAIVENRSGLIALLTGTIIAVIREVRTSRSITAPIAAVGLVLVGLAIEVIGVPTLGQQASGAVTSPPEPGVTSPPEPGVTSPPEPGVTSPPEPGALERWLQESILRPGTANARLATWTDIVDGMTREGTWLLGGSAGSDYLYELCTGISVAPDFVMAGPVCAVDDRGPEPVVRDPHNWIFNIVLYHGLLGLAIFTAALALPSWRARRSPNAMLPVGGIVTYLAAGMTFLISAGYALIPMSFFVAWLLRNTMMDASPIPNLDQQSGLHART